MADHVTDQVTILTSTDGEPVALHDFGGDGPVLLLGHGNGLNAGMWVAVVEHLRARFRCYGIDLRGHGRCRPVNPDYSVDRSDFGRDVLACVEAVGEPVFYAGHSLGGASAIFAAMQRPEAFTSLWLYEPVVIPDDFEGLQGKKPSFLIDIARSRRMEFESVDTAVERFASKPPFAHCDPRSVRAYVEIGSYPVPDGIRLSCEGENEARVFGSGETLAVERLATIEVPTLIAAGGVTDDEHAIPALVAPRLAEVLVNARLERYDDLTHFGPMEDPERIAGSIIDHIDHIAVLP